MPGRLLRALWQRWHRYKYRFVPWIALNLSHNPRTLRHVPEESKDKVISDEDVLETLLKVFQALFLNEFSKQSAILTMLPEPVKSKYQDLLPMQHPRDNLLETKHEQQNIFKPEEILYKTLGFSITRATSSLISAGRGVFVTKGLVPKGAVVSMYPGTVYQKYEPVFFQSIGNPFIFRCLDGVLIDGNDKGISKVVYRSCSGRDRLGPLKMSDSTWLTSELHNPLAVGQYVNNCSNCHFDVLFLLHLETSIKEKSFFQTTIQLSADFLNCKLDFSALLLILFFVNHLSVTCQTNILRPNWNRDFNF
ncbi:SET domain-containing protein 9 isoform X1 [Dipodomys merriami]|uniref:SET domain-containing protein 9 isoform X1 n=1 Tax=Dipodomys merriami TaxID=94247 RepID=UPI003855FE62